MRQDLVVNWCVAVIRLDMFANALGRVGVGAIGQVDGVSAIGVAVSDEDRISIAFSDRQKIDLETQCLSPIFWTSSIDRRRHSRTHLTRASTIERPVNTAERAPKLGYCTKR